MADAAPDRPQLAPENAAFLAEAMGLRIDRERLPEVTAVLTELFALEAVLDDLELTGIDPNVDDTRWPEHGR